MSNYPNMSYCMNENTLAAMNQILYAMREEGPAFLLEMSREERRAFQELFNACEDFLTASEELQEQVEDMEQGFNDGQPDEAQEWADFDPEC
jgi:hypothetical protein